jgi:hypothetical protein
MTVSKPGIILLGLTILGLATLTVTVLSKQKQHARHLYVTSNDHFRIRVQMFPEEGVGFVLGAYYKFQSASMEADDWVDIMTSRQDDPDPIHCENIRFVGDNEAYLYTGVEVAVTVDAGQTWHRWDVTKEFATRAGILDVEIDYTGRGKMILKVIGGDNAQLFTDDFGIHWSTKPKSSGLYPHKDRYDCFDSKSHSAGGLHVSGDRFMYDEENRSWLQLLCQGRNRYRL